MMVLGVGTLLPAWLAVVVCAPTLMVIAWHVLSVQKSVMPRFRKRLRIANGIVMMLVTGLLAYALGVAQVPERPRIEPGASGVFVLVWLAVVGLVSIVVVLAVVDALHTATLSLRAHRALREDSARAIRSDVQSRREESEPASGR